MKLIKTHIENLPITGTRYTVFDDALTGFAVRVGTGGDKAFYYTYRAGKGRGASKRWLRIGSYPSLTVEQARAIAKTNAAAVALGEDPAEQVKEGKTAPTVKEALAIFFEHHDTKIKPNTAKLYSNMVARFIVPTLGKLKVEDVQHKQVAALHHAMRNTPYQANRAAAVLSKFFGWCEKNGYRERGSNPVVGIEKYPEEKRRVFMGKEDMEALGDAFKVLEAQGYHDTKKGKIVPTDPIILASLKVLLFTGARCNEILSLKWEYIDFARGVAHLPDSKTGAKVLQLPPPALLVLEALPRINEYCFYGRGQTGYISNPHSTWRRLLEAANLKGWRIHDLRHAFASYAVGAGKSLPIIGAILGHTQPSTTQRYAHMADNPIAQAAAETAAQIQKDFTSGKVLPFKKAVG